MNLLEVKNLHTYFKTRKGIVKAVNDVSYTLEPGKTVGIVGESGSGKSVSAMSILQLLDGNGYIAKGEVLFDGQDLTKLSQQEMYEIRGNKISVIFQEPMTTLNLTQRLLKKLHPSAEHLAHLPELLAVRLYSQLTMLRLGQTAVKRLFLFVLKPLPKISKA